jgi:hypothetical protein
MLYFPEHGLARKGTGVNSKGWAIVVGAMATMAPQWALAAEDMPTCTAPGPLPAQWSAWAHPVPRDASAGLPAAPLAIGEAVAANLLHTPAVTYPLRPEKPGGSVSYGGLLQVVVTTPGTYRVALGSPAWIDLVTGGGAAIASTAHGHGPACTGIRKIVDFVLDPGTYVLQISANGSAQSEVMVIRQP